MDVTHRGSRAAKLAVIMLNGVGQQACQWPSSLIAALEPIAWVALVDFRGLLNPAYHPSVKDILRDINRVIRFILEESQCPTRPDLYLLGYSFGGMATQLVIGDPATARFLSGFVLLATACEFIPETFARTYGGQGPAPVEDPELLKTVFEPRTLRVGQLRTFIDGLPSRWRVISLPADGLPAKAAWTESKREYLYRKMSWLFPRWGPHLLLNHAVMDYLRCPPSPEHYSPRYVDFAGTLLQNPFTGAPGQGLLVRQLHLLPSGKKDETRRALVVSGSQDALFPLEHCASLSRNIARIFPDTQTIVYCGPDEDLSVPDKDFGGKLSKFEHAPMGHALLFEDVIVNHFATFLAKWLQRQK